MTYCEIRGNIFNSKAQAIVNTVNCVGIMGKGIALEFRRRYPDMFKEYQSSCEKGELKPGNILYHEAENIWILNFVIKRDWRQPSEIEWIESCLEEFIKSYRDKGIKSVAFPWMGAMNGGLPIDQIKKIMRNSLCNIPDIDVVVYDFDPDASDPLFEKLKDIIEEKNSDITDLSNSSDILPRYMGAIIESLQEENIKSLTNLIESRVIGKTNIEKLYAFLIKYEMNKSHTYQKKLF